jgi:DNA mismatch endonuclease (patch repair protein)
MGKIHGGLKDNKLERKVHNWLKGRHIKHRMYPRVVGNPDILIQNNGDPFYVFVDGCFWHCCPLHYKRPKSRQEFWVPHVEGSNKRREELRKRLPYRWVRIWEHDVRNGSFKWMISDNIGDKV